jgi:hypothetical protein
VIAVADADGADAVPLRPRDREIHRARGHRDAGTGLRVGDNEGARIAHHLERGVGVDRPCAEPVDVDADPERAVGVHAA